MAEPVTPNRLPALYGHCVTVYDSMEKKAEMTPEGRVIYKGFLTRMITGELGFSSPFYTTITQALRKMDCVVQISRGGGGTPSHWELLRAPTEDLFLKKKVSSNTGTGPTNDRPSATTDMLLHKVADAMHMLEEANLRLDKLGRACMDLGISLARRGEQLEVAFERIRKLEAALNIVPEEKEGEPLALKL